MVSVGLSLGINRPGRTGVPKAEITEVTTVADSSASLHNTRFQISRGAGAWGAASRCAVVMDCGAIAAVQELHINPGLRNIDSGTWTLGDWTGDVVTVPNPTSWTVNQSLSAADNASSALVLTKTTVGSGVTPLTWDTSSVLMSDTFGGTEPWNGSVSQTSFTQGRDAVTATGGGVTDIPATIAVNAADTDVATAIGTATNGVGWSTSVVSNVATLTDSSTGPRTDAADGTPPTGFGIVITQQGS